MLRRWIARVSLALAAICVALAALLVRPADIHELLLGLAAGLSLGTVQWALLGIALGLLALGALSGQAASRVQRLVRWGLAAAIAAIAVAIIVRDHRAFARETVTLQAADARLQGTVYRPRGASDGRRPAILILHGSGPTKRGGYHLIARRFAERGFVVLNVDKRGVGGSGGRYLGDDLGMGVIERRALDARPALAYLGARADVDTARIGVFAISQGGWIVPLLLAGDTPARFGIIFSGVAVSSAEEGRWSDWAGEDADHFGFEPPPLPFPEIDRRLRSVAPGGFDPRAALARMAFPSLWLFGEWDASAPTAASMRVLDSLRTAGVPLTTAVFPEANHGLFVVRGPRGSRNADFAPGVWDSVFAWTARQGIATLSTRY
jgi:dienelactone hydrolase